MPRIDKIYALVTRELVAHDLADTPANRHDILIKIRDRRLAEGSRRLDDSIQLLAISTEISHIRREMYSRR